MTVPIARRASKEHPCPVCGSGTKGCSVGVDDVHFCRGEPGPEWKQLKRPNEDGFALYRQAGDRAGRPPSVNGTTRQDTTWHVRATEFASKLTLARRKELAALLGLPVSALDSIELLGFYPDHKPDGKAVVPTWTFPERDAAGHIVGINRRFKVKVSISGGEPTNKAMMRGGRRGLTLPTNWRATPGPVFIVEGASDVLALATAGLAGIGRPSNTTGAELLAEALASAPDRAVYVLGENDQKESGQWPGREGVDAVAPRLASLLGRPVRFAFPPADHKDVREWAHGLLAGQGGDVEDWPAIGAEVLRHVERSAEVVTPGRSLVSDAGQTAPSRGRDWSKLFVTSAEFAERDTRPSWLVKQILVWDQPAVVGGPQKVLKTSLLVDLVVSIASGLPFLGRYETAGRNTVAMLSGESGDDSLKRTAIRVCEAKGTTLRTIGRHAIWCFDVPRLTDPDDLGSLADYLAGCGARVVVVDPLYLSLLAGAKGTGPDAKNIYEMGPTLLNVSMTFKAVGITPLVAHHANRQIPIGERMELHHLAFSGIAEFARQWLLLSRREAYEANGRHRLWMNVGGSAGQCQSVALDVNEGVLDDEFGGRVWEVEVSTLAGLNADRAAAQEGERLRKSREKMLAEEVAFLQAMDAEIASGQPAASATAIRRRTGFSAAKVREVADRLIDDGTVAEAEFKRQGGNRSKQQAMGFQRNGRNGGNTTVLFPPSEGGSER